MTGTDSNLSDQSVDGGGLSWPDFCREEVWLTRFLEEVRQVAQMFGQVSIDTLHLDVALASHAQGRELLVAAGLDPQDHWAGAILTIGFNAGRDWVEKRVRPTPGSPPKYVHDDLVQLLELIYEEAQRNRSTVDIRHVLVGRTRYGAIDPSLTVPAVRALTGLPHAGRVVAAGADRSVTYRPAARTPIVVGSGVSGELVPFYVHAGLDVATVTRGKARSDLRVRVAFGEVRPASRDWYLSVLSELGVDVQDVGLYDRETATSTAVVDRLSEADVIFMPGGKTEPRYEILIDTPALRAISRASDAGAVIVGTASGSQVLTVGKFSDYQTEDQQEPFALLNWLENIYTTALRGEDDASRLELSEVSGAFPDARVLALGWGAAVLAEPGWETFTTLRGDHQLTTTAGRVESTRDN